MIDWYRICLGGCAGWTLSLAVLYGLDGNWLLAIIQGFVFVGLLAAIVVRTWEWR